MIERHFDNQVISFEIQFKLSRESNLIVCFHEIIPLITNTLRRYDGQEGKLL